MVMDNEIFGLDDDELALQKVANQETDDTELLPKLTLKDFNDYNLWDVLEGMNYMSIRNYLVDKGVMSEEKFNNLDLGILSEYEAEITLQCTDLGNVEFFDGYSEVTLHNDNKLKVRKPKGKDLIRMQKIRGVKSDKTKTLELISILTDMDKNAVLAMYIGDYCNVTELVNSERNEVFLKRFSGI